MHYHLYYIFSLILLNIYVKFPNSLTFELLFLPIYQIYIFLQITFAIF